MIAHLETIVHLFEFCVLALAGRLIFVWRRPFRKHGRCEGRGCRRCRHSGEKRRLGGRWTARADLQIRQMIDERRSR